MLSRTPMAIFRFPFSTAARSCSSNTLPRCDGRSLVETAMTPSACSRRTSDISGRLRRQASDGRPAERLGFRTERSTNRPWRTCPMSHPAILRKAQFLHESPIRVRAALTHSSQTTTPHLISTSRLKHWPVPSNISSGSALLCDVHHERWNPQQRLLFGVMGNALLVSRVGSPS